VTADEPAAEAPNTPLPELESRLASAEAKAGRSRLTAEAASTLDDFDRSIIARVILYVYAGAITIGFVLIGLRGVGAKPDDWKEIASNAGDLIKTAVLPIVTLVLGYYFGKSKS
jgi:hypothetical protein